MVRVLLTGATGLIGRAAVSALAETEAEVIALSRHGQVETAHHTLPCDLLSPEQTSAVVREARASHLLHLAWHDGPKDRWVSPANLDWMAATLHLIREFSDAGGERAVCAGSCAEYDWSIPELTETSPLRPRTLYGAAKAGTGMTLCAAQETLGLSLAWARIFFVFGPGEPPGRLLGDLITNLKAGRPADCTDGLQERDFLHVDDLARALSALLGSDVAGAVNIASGSAIAVRELIGEVAGQLGRPDLIRLGAITRHPDDPACLAADVTRLRQEVGFEPRYDLKSAVAAVLAAEDTA